MTGSIKPYDAALESAKAALDALLRSGTGSVSMLGVATLSCEIMAQELKAPASVLAYNNMPADKSGFKGPDRWRVDCQGKADAEINPQYLSPDAYARKGSEYLDLGQRLIKDVHVRSTAVVDKKRARAT